MLKKAIQAIVVGSVFISPLIYIKGFAYPGIFPRAMFVFFICEFVVFLFLLRLLSLNEFSTKKSYLSVTLLLYIAILFISALLGSNFLQSFWSSYFRMTGIITWLHYFGFLLVVSTLFITEKDWKSIFRATLLSGIILAGVSFLGVDGLGLKPFSAINEGGSLFGNTSYSGAYYLLAFFISLIGYFIETSKFWKGIYITGLLVVFFNPDLFSFSSTLGMARASSLVLWGGILTMAFLFLLHKFTTKKIVAIVSTLIFLLISGTCVYSIYSILHQEGKIYETYLEESGPARVLVWGMGIEGIKAHPMLGYGAENFNYVFQEHFDPKIINVEQSTEWFDNAHNFIIGHILDTGIIGGIVMLAIFCLVVFASFRLYWSRDKFYFLIIPFTLLFHFLQIQTFFQTDSALLLVFTLLAFLVSQDTNFTFKIPEYLNNIVSKSVLAILLCTSVYFFVYIPMQENLLVSNINTTKDRNKRISLQRGLSELKVYPMGALELLSSPFMDSTALNKDALVGAGLKENVAEEYKIYIDAYEKYLYRYANSYRYRVEYANLINAAFIFGVDELKRGEEVALRALEISKSYPHAYLMLALNLHNQGRDKEALSYAEKAVKLDPSIEQSQKIYNTLKSRSKLKV